MGNSEDQLSLIFDAIASEINISDAMATKAIESYEAVGTFLGNNISDSNVRIMPQGSFNLGTVVRPLNDEDSDYDIDLVCLLEDASAWDEERIKKTIGAPLENSNRYGPSMEPEGKRCWTLSYSGFHMDILPCAPRYCQYTNDETSIRLTHRQTLGRYEPKYSNPHLYGLWFEKCMTDSLMEARQNYASRNAVSIDSVQTYNVRTPLQKAVQLLKRHRDILFAEDSSDAPISIIITTLAGLGYSGKGNLYDTLKEILLSMESAIRVDTSGSYYIDNPVEASENFADKWNEEQGKADSFYRWLHKAQKDIISDPENAFGLDQIIDGMKPAFGEKIVTRAYDTVGNKVRVLRESEKLGVLDSVGGPANYRESMRGANGLPLKSATLYAGTDDRCIVEGIRHHQEPRWPIIGQIPVRIKAEKRIEKGFGKFKQFKSGESLPKQVDLRFTAEAEGLKEFHVYWQVTNTGDEAYTAKCPRGDFYDGQIEEGKKIRKEATAFAGTHYVECYLVKDEICYGRSKPFVVEISLHPVGVVGW